MRMTVIGCGYLGAIHAACMAELGHEVIGIDVDPEKVTALQAARAPFFEPGAALAWNPEFLREGHAVEDTLTPDRLVYGVPGGPGSTEGKAAKALLDEVYATPLGRGTPLIVTDYQTAELGADQTLTFLREVDSINMRRRIRMVDLAREVCEGSLIGKRVAVLGAAFKPLSDDIRDSPALNVAAQIRLQGGDVVLTDPAAVDNARKAVPDISYADSVEEAVRGADVVLLLTEWKEYRELEPATISGLVKEKRILDGRNALDPGRWRAAGWTYRALGRPRA
ncbi:UDP binding domain-containing protein [Kineococcus mangrovi]